MNDLLIFNPHAGKKRKTLTLDSGNTLIDIQRLLKQYQIPIDLAPTRHHGHALELAKEAVKHKYSRVLVAGGDGTIGEAANGLIGSHVTLGILPMGSVMNIAKMLSIPLDIEKAVMLLKIGRCRKIDVGCLSRVHGEKVEDPDYFIESAGVGLDAQFYKYYTRLGDGDITAFWGMIKTLISFYKTPVTVITDEKTQEVRTTFITISNGPLSGAAIRMAPDAKLNDRLLTVGLYKQNLRTIIGYFFNSLRGKMRPSKKEVEFILTKKVKIDSKKHIPLHVDGRIFSSIPATFEIKPSALNIVCGFPTEIEDKSLLTRTPLDS